MRLIISLGEFPLDGHQVKLVKWLGEFVWRHHEAGDKLFLVVRGSFGLEVGTEWSNGGPGEFLIVPRRVEHRPVAEKEVEVLLFEPAATVNAGSAGGDRTVVALHRV